MTQPLSVGQRAIWFDDHVNPDSTRYHDGLCFRLHGRLNASALDEAVRGIVERHVALRTVFPLADGTPVRHVLPTAPTVRWHRPRAPIDERDGAALAFAHDVVDERYDLGHGPLFRVAVLSFDDEDHVLVLAQHHIVIDGWSVGVILNELSDRYAAACLGVAFDRPPPRTTYDGFVEWQLRESARREDVDYWIRECADTTGALVARRQLTAGTERSSDVLTVHVPDDVVEALHRACRNARVSPATGYLAAFELLLSRASGLARFLVGYPVWGRPFDEFLDVVGYFANVLPLRVEIDENVTVAEWWRMLQRSTRAAMAHGDVPYADIVHAVGGSGATAGRPLVDATFQYFADGVLGELGLTDIDVVPVEVTNNASPPFPLSIDVVTRPGGVGVTLTHDGAAVDSASATALMQAFLDLLTSTVRSPDALVRDVPAAVPRLAPESRSAVAPARGAAGGAPRPGVESLVAGVMAEVLGVSELSRDDDFFALGAQSLAAVRVVTRVKQRLGVELSVRSLLDRPTVAGFAEVVEKASRGHWGIPVLPEGKDAPASAAQSRMWFVHQVAPESSAYNMGEAYLFASPIDGYALEAAVRAVAARQGVLRTRFAVVADELRQVVDPEWTGAVGRHRLGRDETARLSALVEELLDAPYDLEHGPVFRVDVVAVDGQGDVVVLGIHHIASDGVSMGVLFRDLTAAYDAALAGGAAVLTPLPVQYTDFAAWQMQRLAAGELGGQLAYWTQRLDGATTVSSLVSRSNESRSAELAGPPGAAAGCVRHELSSSPSLEHGEHLQIDRETTRSLRELASRQGVTLFGVLFAAFAVTLSRVTGETDLLIGVPVAGRDHAALEDVIGFFVNMLPVRVDVGPSADGAAPTFVDVVERARVLMSEAMGNAEVPFDQIVSAVNPLRVAGVSPLVQVAFQVFEEPADPDFTLGGIAATPLGGTASVPVTGSRAADLPMAVDITATPDGGLDITLTVDAAIVDARRATETGAVFAGALRSVGRQPAQPVDDLEFLDDRGDAITTVRFAGDDNRQKPRVETLLSAFERTARYHPDRVAISDGAVAETFAVFAARVAGMRSAVPPDHQRVGVLLPRGVSLVAALLGALAAGATVVPLDPSEPLERRLRLLEAADVTLLITDRSSAGQHSDIETLIADECPPSDAALGAVVPRRTAAVLLYTSGSTGAPKGVVLEHGGLANLLDHHAATTQTGDVLRVAMTASVAFDALWDQLLWLIAGHQLIVVGEDDRRDTIALLKLVRQERIDVLDVPQSQVSVLLELGMLSDGHAPSVLIMGGEPVAPRLWRTLRTHAGLAAANYYGPTECTVDALIAPLTADEVPVIGRPIRGARVYVLDRRGRSVPPGVVGEICIAGGLVARGYLNDPRATAGAFVPDPFAEAPGARMYRTGDMGRFRSDGLVEITGRLDEQRKIRGHRVEPAEVTAALLADPLVDDAATTYVEDDSGALMLCSFVVSTSDPHDVLRRLGDRLPAHLIPANITVVASIPRTASGKLAAGALPAPTLRHDSAAVTPRPGVESLVARVMAEVLGVSELSRDDDFFAMGGHSLRAARVVARVRERLGVELSVRSLLDRPTVAGFAEVVEKASRGHWGIPVLPEGKDAPASAAQSRMWFVHQVAPESSAYNMGEAYLFASPIDGYALEAAVRAVAARQGVLRTRFAVVADELRQVVDPEWTGAVGRHRLGRDETARLSALVEELLDAPYDLEHGPVFRVDVVAVDGQGDVVVLGIHHIASDGVSMGVLFRDLTAAYDAALAGGAAVLTPLPVQYTDFAAWQMQRLAAGELGGQLAYWTQRLDGASTMLQWPGGRGAARDEESSRAVEFAWDAPTTRLLRELASRQGVTLFGVLFAAFAVTLSRVTGETDLLIGVPVAGRDHAALEDVIGFFVNMLPVRVDVGPSADGAAPTFVDVVERARVLMSEAMGNAEVPFDQIVSAVNPLRVAGVSPLVQVAFQVFEEPADPDFTLGGIRGSNVRADLRGTRFDMTIDVYRSGDGLRGWIYHDASVVDAELARAIVAQFVQVATEGARSGMEQLDRSAVSGSDSWHDIGVGDATVQVRTRAVGGVGGHRLWPSVGEYPLYDDFLYYVMLQDHARNELFQKAIERHAPGRTVVELGTGPDLLWASLAARSGAARVMAVEAIAESARAAVRLSAEKQLGIDVVHGDATSVELPARATMCIVELVGSIGGSEGIAEVIADAWARHLEPGAVVVPHRVRTRVAAFGARDLLPCPPAVDEHALSYLDAIFSFTGSPFDVRMSLTGLAREDLLTTSDLLEDLDLSASEQSHAESITLTVTRPGSLDSALLWLELQCAPDQEILDALDTITNWVPVLVPFDLDEAVAVEPGDSVHLAATRSLSDGVHPEWRFTGEIRRQDRPDVSFHATSAYSDGPLRASWLHRELFRVPNRGARP